MADEERFTEPPIADDEDNPHWTGDDFARSSPAATLPRSVMEAFPATKAQLLSERTAIDLPAHTAGWFQAQSPDWRDRIVEVLEAHIAREEAAAR